MFHDALWHHYSLNELIFALKRGTAQYKHQYLQPLNVWSLTKFYTASLVQDCRISIANALKIPQSSTNPLIYWLVYINGLVQDCSDSLANTLELPHSSTKPSASALLIQHFMQNCSISTANALELPVLQQSFNILIHKQLNPFITQSIEHKWVSARKT